MAGVVWRESPVVSSAVGVIGLVRIMVVLRYGSVIYYCCALPQQQRQQTRAPSCLPRTVLADNHSTWYAVSKVVGYLASRQLLGSSCKRCSHAAKTRGSAHFMLQRTHNITALWGNIGILHVCSVWKSWNFR